MLTRPPHVITVQRRKASTDANGATVYVADGGPVEVQCTVRSRSAAEDLSGGVAAATDFRILARTWPGDIDSLITWKGVELEPVGDPLPYDGSRRTQHFEIRANLTQQSREAGIWPR